MASFRRPLPEAADWHLLPDALQLVLAREAFQRAVQTVLGQVEVLADEMHAGTLTDYGGPDALRLLAAIVRVSAEENLPASGHA